MANPNIGNLGVGFDIKPSPADLAQLRIIGRAYAQAFADEFKNQGLLVPDRATVRRTERNYERIGTRTGRAYSRSFLRETREGFRQAQRQAAQTFFQIAKIVTVFGETIGVALAGLAAAATAITFSLGSGIIGALAPAVPILGALGAAAGVLVIGLQGITGELENLSPSAREFREWLDDIRPTLEAIQQIVQERLFEGIAESLGPLAEQLPSISGALAEIAGSLNQFFRDTAEGLAEFDIGQILRDFVPILNNLFAGFVGLGTALTGFVQAASPAAEELAGWFRDWAEGLADAATSVDGVTAIQGFLDTALGSLRTWLDLFGAIGDTIAAVFDQATESGDGLIQDLTGVIREFNNFLRSVEGQNALQTFFQNGERVVKAFGPILAGLAEAFRRIVTPEAITRFEEFTALVGELLPIIGTLISEFGKTGVLNAFAQVIVDIASALEPLLPVLSNIATILVDAFLEGWNAVVESGAIDAVVEALIAFLEAIEPLLPQITELIVIGLENFIPVLQATAVVINSLAYVIEQLMPVLQFFAEGWLFVARVTQNATEIIGAAVGLMASFIAVTIGELALRVEQIFNGIMTFATEIWTGIITFITGAVRGLRNAVVGTIEALRLRLAGIWNAISSFVTGVWEGIRDGVVTIVSGFVGTIVSLLTGLRNIITGLWSGLESILTAPFRAAERIINGIVDRIISAWNRAKEFVSGGLNPFGDIRGIPLLAKGGVINAPTNAIVGEAGPEVVIPLARSLANMAPDVRPYARAMQVGLDVMRHQRPSTTHSVINDNRTNNFTINEASDPRRTADRVFNRLLSSQFG